VTTQSTFDASYDALQTALAQSGAVVDAAELHGGICGALCAGGTRGAERWLVECFEAEEVHGDEDLERSLHALVTTSERMLEDRDLAFTPLLPDDDTPLADQVQAFASWCHGFLSGLGASAPDVGQDAPAGQPPRPDEETVAEVLRDFAELSRAGLSDDEAEGRNAPDFALAELVEYLRVGVQVVYEELAERRAAVRDAH